MKNIANKKGVLLAPFKYYWSSTEYNDSLTHTVDTGNGYIYYIYAKSDGLKVRPFMNI